MTAPVMTRFITFGVPSSAAMFPASTGTMSISRYCGISVTIELLTNSAPPFFTDSENQLHGRLVKDNKIIRHIDLWCTDVLIRYYYKAIGSTAALLCAVRREICHFLIGRFECSMAKS